MPRERKHLRYQLYKSQSRKLAAQSVAHLQRQLKLFDAQTIDLSRVRFDPINTQALDAFELWDDPYFSWNEVIGWKAREPLALDIAIWFEEELCGLCFADPNNSRRRLRIVRLEGRPGGTHPLKNRIGMLALIVIEQYAQFIGCTVLKIQEPLSGAVSVYQKLGFGFDNEGRLVKSLENQVP
ncbi:hypothetical protein ACOI9X_26980 [Pseudomonas sp. P2757]|uniref:hypothetical protein n=1 Tax=unclassified Pseudomonas TaxID=196821 RepID=UPI003B5A9B4C